MNKYISGDNVLYNVYKNNRGYYYKFFVPELGWVKGMADINSFYTKTKEDLIQYVEEKLHTKLKLIDE